MSDFTVRFYLRLLSTLLASRSKYPRKADVFGPVLFCLFVKISLMKSMVQRPVEGVPCNPTVRIYDFYS